VAVMIELIDLVSDESSSDESTASYETVMFPDYPRCREYHLRTGQHQYTHMKLQDIRDDGVKYKSVIERLELTDILYQGLGSVCGRLHWVYIFVKVYQDGWHTALLTDGCIDRLLGFNAQEFRDATGERYRLMRQTKICQFILMTESRIKLMIHRDGPRDLLFISALTILDRNHR
jgi:hypothetical protein